MKEFIKGLVSSIITAYIVTGLTAVVGLIVAIINPSIIPWIIIGLAVVIIILIASYFLLFGVTKFKWTHFFKHDINCLTLKKDGTGLINESICTKSKKKFNGTVTFHYDWSDVKINSVELKADKSSISLDYTDETGQNKKLSNSNLISLKDSPTNADSFISFNGNEQEDINMEIVFDYDISKMKPEYYLEVNRPTKKIIMEVKIHKDIRIRNICKKIVASHGDIKESEAKHIKGKKCKNDPNMISYISYKFVVRHPKILHSYVISWEWIK